METTNKMNRCCARVAFLLFAFGLGSLLASPLHTGTPIWSEEFNDFSSKRPNSSIWSYDLGDGGWGNGELQDYREENVDVESGYLRITADYNKTCEKFTSGRVKTMDKLTYRYGNLVARIKIPNVSDGLWPAFWTMGENFAEVGWPSCGEIDIMEIGQGDALKEGIGNRRVVSGAHWEHNGTYAMYARNITVPEDLNDGFHIYELNWTPTSMTTYVDGAMIWTMYIGLDKCTDCQELHQPHFILLNLAVGGGFTGSGYSSGCGSSGSSGGCGRTKDEITARMPATMWVDWIHIYQNGNTEVFVGTNKSNTRVPTVPPSSFPSAHGGNSNSPSLVPSSVPPEQGGGTSNRTTSTPSLGPSPVPSVYEGTSNRTTQRPSLAPSSVPSDYGGGTFNRTTRMPSQAPSPVPSVYGEYIETTGTPSRQTYNRSTTPRPTVRTQSPVPSKGPSDTPTLLPSSTTSSAPSVSFTVSPSYHPSEFPSVEPSFPDSAMPSTYSHAPSPFPVTALSTSQPSPSPWFPESERPTATPLTKPKISTFGPTDYPTSQPSVRTSREPSMSDSFISGLVTMSPTDADVQGTSRPTLTPPPQLRPSVRPIEAPSLLGCDKDEQEEPSSGKGGKGGKGKQEKTQPKTGKRRLGGKEDDSSQFSKTSKKSSESSKTSKKSPKSSKSSKPGKSSSCDNSSDKGKGKGKGKGGSSYVKNGQEYSENNYSGDGDYGSGGGLVSIAAMSVDTELIADDSSGSAENDYSSNSQTSHTGSHRSHGSTTRTVVVVVFNFFAIVMMTNFMV